MLVGFIVPFLPASQSKNWLADCELLNKTLSCLLKQTCREFKIFVVHSEKPARALEHPQIKYISYPQAFQSYEEIQDAERYFHLFKRKHYMARFYDKGKKVTFGCEIAKREGCRYIMSVDADDLISNQTVEFVRNNHDNFSVDGWYFPHGYVWQNNSKTILRQSKMHLYNGSTHLIRADIVWTPDWTSTDWSDYSLFAAHGWTVERLKEHFDKHLQPIPFRGVIYVVHNNNDSQLIKSFKQFSLKAIGKKLVRGQILSRQIKTEFNIE